ncbi:MAG: methyl-accepting chemotaxis protein, partial [Sulfuriferula sp.]
MNVKLKTKIILSMGGVVLLFTVAISVALTGMQGNRSRFENFLQQDLALAQAASGLYAQGLQIGQAIRNLVMDPNNPNIAKALEQSSNEFKRISQEALALAADSPADLKVLHEVVALREQQIPIHAKIASLAHTDQAAAITAISQEETPIWRGIRLRLMDFAKAKRAAVDVTKTEMIANSQRMLTITLILLALAVVAASTIAFWLIRHIMKQLGGEPVYAVEVARAISAGDFSREITVARGDSTS